MLNDFIRQAINEHGFEAVYSSNDANMSFYRKECDDLKRYLITYKMESLSSINNIDAPSLNQYVVDNTPQVLLDSPSFSKNTDLIIIYRMGKLSEYSGVEDKILSFEENAYHFKKYFLHYSSEEEEFLNEKTYSDLKQTLLQYDSFSEYKNFPLKPCLYNIAARIFIKLPFLEMPSIEKELTPIEFQISTMVDSLGLAELYSLIDDLSLDNDDDLDNLLGGLINAELAIIEAGNK
ncbi:ABC-three component system middle component 1 [Yersinia enterocolitica]|uniref:ABC-three component system middle component 1 n=1 Tax=Yersinia enterocolitica TaxID=630 RepID=UPI001F5853EA|nr:ABC-three component system middle component 1 [Yersinia enterocolitica]EKN4026298.1 hypothetical protein [Yersinia enterocolitica]EKN4921327.1 hypothetical protein [Yersinia enterocolitica]ELI8014960.1 hypothetical protein [Yersinia enterocolitica]ELI8193187.1 hypothetical protein [Yersinia enterocolitica]